jgi:hypothetical protein
MRLSGGKVACLGAVWVGENGRVLGVAGGVTGGELLLAGVLICSSVWMTGGAGLSAGMGGRLSRSARKWATLVV